MDLAFPLERFSKICSVCGNHNGSKENILMRITIVFATLYSSIDMTTSLGNLLDLCSFFL
jgi:hypothetical protein